jgi:hypothetical protein
MNTLWVIRTCTQHAAPHADIGLAGRWPAASGAVVASRCFPLSALHPSLNHGSRPNCTGKSPFNASSPFQGRRSQVQRLRRGCRPGLEPDLSARDYAEVHECNLKAESAARVDICCRACTC